MTVEIAPDARVQVTTSPSVAPGTCILCGVAGGDNREFIDFGMQIDWIGAIYFCSDCFGVAARSLGWVPVAEFNELLTELKNTTAEKDSAVKSNQRIKDGLSLILPELGREPESVDAYIDGLMATIQESPGSEGTDEMHATGESETNESDNVEGPDDLFDASDFDE